MPVQLSLTLDYFMQAINRLSDFVELDPSLLIGQQPGPTSYINKLSQNRQDPYILRT